MSDKLKYTSFWALAKKVPKVWAVRGKMATPAIIFLAREGSKCLEEVVVMVVVIVSLVLAAVLVFNRSI